MKKNNKKDKKENPLSGIMRAIVYIVCFPYKIFFWECRVVGSVLYRIGRLG